MARSPNAVSVRKLIRWADYANPEGMQLTPLHQAAFENDINKARELIIGSANVNHADARGFTPLHDAAMAGAGEIAQLLIDAGSALNVQDKEYGYTPLHDAVRECHKDVVKLLLAAGADTTVRNKVHSTPLDLAKEWQFKDIITLLQNNK